MFLFDIVSGNNEKEKRKNTPLLHGGSGERTKTMADKPTQSHSGLQPPDDASAGSAAPFPALTMDWEEFAHHLEDSDLSDDQKREFIETLWSIVVAFVDLGFDVRSSDNDPVACGQVTENGIFLPADLLKIGGQKTEF